MAVRHIALSKTDNLLWHIVFNEQMMEEISEVMDEIELEILNMMYEYSTRVTNEKDHINALLLWLATLGRGNRNLADTLHGYLYKFMKDMEAAVAALKFSNVPVSEAITKAKTFLHSVYTMPEMLRAFRFAERFAATYIRSRGIERGAVGISNNGSTNVVNMAKTTLQMAFMREYRNEMEEDGAAGYYVLRGSDYPCDLCDSKVGFHPISDKENFPPYHPHCCCIAIPINFQKQ